MLNLKPGPVYLSSSENEEPTYVSGRGADSHRSYLRDMAEWREKARSEAIATLRTSPEVESVQRYIECLQGSGWWDKSRPLFKSRLYDNRLNNSRKNDLALLTDSKPTINVTTNVSTFKENAEIAQNVINYEWTNQNMDLALIGAVDLAKLNGTSFWKHMAGCPGVMQVLECGPDQVLPIQPGFNIQSSTAVMYRTWQAVAYLMRKHPYHSEKILRETPFQDSSFGSQKGRYNRPNHIPNSTWEGLSPQMKRLVGTESSASDMGGTGLASSLEKQEYWIDDPSINESNREVVVRNPYVSLAGHNYWYVVKPGEMLYPRKRLVVYVGRTLVYDGPSPFWHGQFPFSCLRLDPVKWSFYGLSKYRDLLPINQAMNEIAAGIMDNIKNILNPTVVSKSNAMTTATWNAFYPGMPMAKLLLLPNANIGDVKYLDPPPIPAWILTFHQYLSQEFDRLSGAIDIMNLGKKKQVPGADTVEQMREALNTTTRLEGRYIEKFLQDAGGLAVSDIFQHYETDVLTNIMGAQGITLDQFGNNGKNLVPDGKFPENHWRNYAMKVDAGSLLSNQRDRDRQMAMSMTTNGLMAIKTLHEKLGFPPEAYKDLVEEQKNNIHAGGGKSRTGRGQRNGKSA